MNSWCRAARPGLRDEAFGSRLANVNGLGLELGRFHLDSQMVDPEVVVQFLPDSGEELRMLNGLVVVDVGRKGLDPGRYCPHVQVVDTDNTAGLEDRLLYRSDADVSRGPLQQHIHRIQDKPPSADDNDRRYQDTPDRVGPYPAEGQYRHPRDNRRD